MLSEKSLSYASGWASIVVADPTPVALPFATYLPISRQRPSASDTFLGSSCRTFGEPTN